MAKKESKVARAKSHPEKKSRNIYLFLFEESHCFFLNDTIQGSAWKYYDGHYRERYAATRAQFVQSKKQNITPPMYLLDTVIGTKHDVFQRKIEWTKYFVEHGYKSLLGPKMEAIVSEFDPDESEFYRSIRDIPVEKQCPADKNLMAEYRNSSKRKRTERSQLASDMERIVLIVRKEEGQKYRATAEEYGVPLSEYILDCVRFGGVFQVDTIPWETYIRQIEKSQTVFDGLLATYLLTGEYYPADICKMEETSKRIAKTNREVKKELGRLCRQLKSMKEGKQVNANPLE